MIKDEVKALLEKDFNGKIDHPSVEKFGDFAIRGDIKIKENKELIEKIERIAGFTNIFINKNKLVKAAAEIGSKDWLKELAKTGSGQTMVIDYSAPNIAKPFGIGHLRSTNIGQAIYNIYQILGWKCIGDNHLGDWGTQFGKLIVAIKKWGDKEVEKMSIEDLEKLYVKFHQEAEKDEKLEDEAREYFAKLENNEAEAKLIWQKCVDISLKEFDRVYKLLGVKIDYALGESFYRDKMDEVIEMMDKQGITKSSQGAKIIEFEKMPPVMVVKSNGTTTYFTRDVATVKYRMTTWQPDLIIYEIGADQELHCRQLFETARLMNWKPRFYHVAHGLIRWKEGKFSTRHGDTIHLSEVIERAMAEAKKIAPDNDQQKLEAVAIGAIKFNDLAQDPKKDIIFDWDKVMSMEGNSGPYLQYTYARCLSVINKSKKQAKINGEEKWEIEESNLLREFYKFEEKIIEAGERFCPAVVAEYLLSLARKYNEFYSKYRIIGQAEEGQRIFLTERCAKILEIGLKLLGIERLTEM